MDLSETYKHQKKTFVFPNDLVIFSWMIPNLYLKKHRFLAPSKPIFSTKTKPSWPRHFDGLVFVSWLCGNRYNHCIRSAESQHRTSTETWTNHHESSWWQFMTGTLNKKMEWLIYVSLESLALHICPRCLLNVVSFPKKHSGVNNEIIRKTKKKHSAFI